MSDEIDPEVLADLRLRDASERDATRTRGHGTYDWKPERPVAAWRCKADGCTELVPVTEEAFERLAICNRQLRRKGERPIDTSEIMFCAAHEVASRQITVEMQTGHVQQIALVIRQLFAGEEKPIEIRDEHGVRFVGEEEALRQLREWRHPDVDGLTNAIRERNKRNRGRKERL